MSAVLISLQRSVQGVLLGRLSRPDWFTHGVPVNSKIQTFQARITIDVQNAPLAVKSMASDGQFLYLFTNRGLFKIGSGYGGTVKGHVYVWKPDFYPNDKGTLVYCSVRILLILCKNCHFNFMNIYRMVCI